MIDLSTFDIVEITPKAFDWKDVKPGMAFETETGQTCYYTSECLPQLDDELLFKWNRRASPFEYQSFYVDSLTRAPLL